MLLASAAINNVLHIYTHYQYTYVTLLDWELDREMKYSDSPKDLEERKRRSCFRQGPVSDKVLFQRRFCFWEDAVRFRHDLVSDKVLFQIGSCFREGSCFRQVLFQSRFCITYRFYLREGPVSKKVLFQKGMQEDMQEDRNNKEFLRLLKHQGILLIISISCLSCYHNCQQI